MPQCIVLLFVVQFEFESLCSNLNLNVFVFLLEKKMESFSLSLSWFPAHPAQPLLFPSFFSPGPTSPRTAQSSRPSCLSRPAPPFPLSSHADRAAPPVGVLFFLARAPRRCLWPRSSPAAAGGPLRPSKPSRRGPPHHSRSAPASDPTPPLHACLARTRTRVGRGHASPGILDPHVETDHGAL